MSEPPLTSLPGTQSVNSTTNASSVTHQKRSKHIPQTGDSDSSTITKLDSTPNSTRSITISGDASKGRNTTSTASRASELAHLKVKLRAALRQFPDFPSPGILFEDILPIFADPSLHSALQSALEYSVEDICADVVAAGSAGAASTATTSVPTTEVRDQTAERLRPEVIVGLEARGFLFGPALALRLGAAFVPVRKQGKLPGRTWSASYVKEYGEDVFEMQQDVIKAGQRVLIVDDIIATGGSAAAAGSLVKQSGGQLIAYVFIMELDFLNGRAKVDAPVLTLLSGQAAADTTKDSNTTL